jgi:hypothetical protein
VNWLTSPRSGEGKAMSLEQKEIENDLAGNRWEVDCVSCSLTQNETAAPQTFSGKGFLRQAEDGTIHLRLYPTEIHNYADGQILAAPCLPGQLIPPKAYFSFRGRDMAGRYWTCSRVRPDVSESCHPEGTERVVSGTIYDLRSEGNSGAPEDLYLLRVVFFSDTDLTAGSFDAKVQEALSAQNEFGKFTIQNEVGKLVISCQSDKPHQEYFFLRVTESLSFVLGRRLYWNCVEEYRHGKVIRRVIGLKQSDQRRLPQPVEERISPWAQFTWQLFSRYLAFVCSHEGDSLHGCSRLLYAVYQAQQGTIHAKALALGVAVEGLCKELFPQTTEQSDQLRRWVGGLRKHCELWEGFRDAETKKALFDRLGGLLGQLTSTRPKDTLMRLQSERVVYDRHVRAWGTLRNRAAHANMNAADSLQELVDLCDAVTVLLYHLVFKAIGYEGAYTDWSEYGHPAKWFRGRPPTEEEIAVAAYFLYLKEPDRHGNDWHHWFTARAMLESGRC